MPPWVAFVPRLTTLIKGRAIARLPSAFRCCNVTISRPSNLRIRSASTHVSPTAINVRPNIPPKNKELYNALSELSGAAEAHVNISRLQLALRGLAAQDAVTRVAVLGLNNQISAQKLARLLLADPLGVEERWEKELEKSDDGDEQAVLLRFGDESDALPPTPLFKVLSIPSRILRTHNLEILVSTLNVNVAGVVASVSTESSKDAVLVPKLQATSARGLPVPYPVHKTLILGEGLDSAVAYGKFTSDSVGEIGDVVKVAINLPPPLKEADPNEQSTSTAVNVDVGTEALASFRQSIQNVHVYEQGWFRSGLPALSKWLVQGLQPSEPFKPAIKSLIASVADDAEANITREDAQQLDKLASSTSQQETAVSVIGHLETWAEKSHRELRDQLDEAFTARNWHKLAWWKLFWRVDDVTMITSEILERRWLVDAEKNSIYLAGRMSQVGFPEDISKLTITPPESPEANTSIPTQNSSPIPKPQTDLSTQVHHPNPWPAQISTSRASLLSETIPPLQALAQRLVLQTLSTTSLSAALSALLYVSVSTVSLFEASAVAALGLTFSLRRMQKLWEGAREMWQGEVREEGRRTLKYTEELVRLIVRNSKVKEGEDEGVKERRVAREAVQRVREALERM